MELEKTNIPEVVALTPRRFSDDRGYFSEVWNKATMAAAGLDIEFVQDNHSFSAQKGTVRGLHCQVPPHAQAKLVRCARGRILDVAVDIRQGSPTEGQHVAVELSAENGRQLLVPVGFLHGFVTLTDDCEVLYKCSGFYAPDCDRSVYFADPAIGVNWGVDEEQAQLSQKDAAAPGLAAAGLSFIYGEGC